MKSHGIVVALFVGLSAQICGAVQPANPQLCGDGRAILAYFESIYGKKTLAGYNVYPHTPDDYQQTARHAAIWGRDIRWLGNAEEVIAHAKKYGYILTLHWHWFFDGDSAWKDQRKTPVNVEKVVTPGTREHEILLKELSEAADVLEKLQDAGIVVLWRPLHEIDGGWFWWTDLEHPENTAELWRMMFRYFTHDRKLNNLIWVYSAGVGDLKKKPAEWRQRFYPGAEYVDISGIDIYGVDPQADETRYWDYFHLMEKVSPGKMLALCECDEIPNPDKMAAGRTPCWLYALPWWGPPHPRRPVKSARLAMSHDHVITLEELPVLGKGPYAPALGILEPEDDGTAWFNRPPNVTGYVVARGSQVTRLEFLANGRVIGSLEQPPSQFRWNWPADLRGTFDLEAKAYSQAGEVTTSNRVHVAVGVRNAARGAVVRTSSGVNPEAAVDGSYYTSWQADKDAEQAWIEIDLGKPQQISQLNLIWGWKIHPARFTVETTLVGPEQTERSWQVVCQIDNLPWVTWKATHRVQFSEHAARYIRIQALQRVNRQTWGGYDLAEIEVPVPIDP